MKGIVKRLDRTGHTAVEFDTERPDTQEEARALIEAAFAGSALVFDTATKPGEQLRAPSDVDLSTLTDVTIVPQFAGG